MGIWTFCHTPGEVIADLESRILQGSITDPEVNLPRGFYRRAPGVSDESLERLESNDPSDRDNRLRRRGGRHPVGVTVVSPGKFFDLRTSAIFVWTAGQYRLPPLN